MALASASPPSGRIGESFERHQHPFGERQHVGRRRVVPVRVRLARSETEAVARLDFTVPRLGSCDRTHRLCEPPSTIGSVTSRPSSQSSTRPDVCSSRARRDGAFHRPPLRSKSGRNTGSWPGRIISAFTHARGVRECCDSRLKSRGLAVRSFVPSASPIRLRDQPTPSVRGAPSSPSGHRSRRGSTRTPCTRDPATVGSRAAVGAARDPDRRESDCGRDHRRDACDSSPLSMTS